MGVSAVWLAVAAIGACLAFIGMYRSGAHASGGAAQLTPLIACFGGGVMWVAIALRLALRPLLPALRPDPEPTVPVVAEITHAVPASGIRFGRATVRYVDGQGVTRESQLISWAPLVVGHVVNVKYHPESSDWVIADQPGDASGPPVLRLLPMIAVGGGILVVASPLFSLL
ncbi:MAG: hypothetical protein JHD16_16480 [Solirubrobacteraceae bacterium]|nr:hypothetical protein [Solirubrobacteraceae bacterium]